MNFLFCPDISIFAFPFNLIALLFWILGIWILHRYYSQTSWVRWLTGMPATLLVTGIIICLLIAEGIWALQLFKTWIFILLQLVLLLLLGLVVLRRTTSLKVRNVLFLLNHAGLWIALAAALFGAPDREEYKMIAPLNRPEYNVIDASGALHPLPFTVCLNKFELEYYPQSGSPKVPKRFCSYLTLKHKDRIRQIPVEVNAPARFKGYSIYQDGYDQSQGAESSYSILLIVRDPWLPGVYAGIFMLLAGAAGLIIYGPIKKLKL